MNRRCISCLPWKLKTMHNSALLLSSKYSSVMILSISQYLISASDFLLDCIKLHLSSLQALAICRQIRWFVLSLQVWQVVREFCPSVMCIILQLWNLATASHTKNNTLLKLLPQWFFPLRHMDLILEFWNGGKVIFPEMYTFTPLCPVVLKLYITLESSCTTLLVQHYCLLPPPLYTCLTRLKLKMYCTINVVQFDPALNLQNLSQCTNSDSTPLKDAT